MRARIAKKFSYISRLLPFFLMAPMVVMPLPAQAVPDPQSGGGGAYEPTVAARAPVQAVVEPVAPRPPDFTLHADIDLAAQRLTVTAGGRVLHVWPISSGRAGYETPRGSFRPQWAARMHYSKKYDNAPMPHSVFFNGGVATHGTQSIALLGRPASHGCIRLHPSAAAAFYALVHKHGFAATRIVVHGRSKDRGGELVASRGHREDARPRLARQPSPQRSVNLVQPAGGYGYAPAYGYATPRQVYVVRRPAYGPTAGYLRYPPQGYVRY